MKRARAAERERSPEDPLKAQRQHGSEELRQLLLDRFFSGGLSGADVALISHWVTEAGGTGVADLALDPEQATAHGHRHVHLHAGKSFPEPDMTLVRTPLYIKREARRVLEPVPVVMPSTLFKKFVEIPEILQHADTQSLVGLPCYDVHPAVRNAMPGFAPRPVALYWDGVQYSVHDSFTGFYVTDILSGQKFLSFLLSRSLSCPGLWVRVWGALRGFWFRAQALGFRV